MLTRIDIDGTEWEFLNHHKILLSHVYDARGQGLSTFGERAKAEGKLYGLTDGCTKARHRLYTRAGYCMQCDTQKIAHMRAYEAQGYVYIAASISGKLLKIGATTAIESRNITLNREGGYAGYADWEIIAHAKTTKMGVTEFNAFKPVENLRQKLAYIKDGRTQIGREALVGDLRAVWEAYKAAITHVPITDRWQHRKFKAFNFVA